MVQHLSQVMAFAMYVLSRNPAFLIARVIEFRSRFAEPIVHVERPSTFHAVTICFNPSICHYRLRFFAAFLLGSAFGALGCRFRV
jgi:hypothetical protein